MSSDYPQLLEATIQHLQEQQRRGVRFVNLSPETLALLKQPVARVAPALPVQPRPAPSTIGARVTRPSEEKAADPVPTPPTQPQAVPSPMGARIARPSDEVPAKPVPTPSPQPIAPPPAPAAVPADAAVDKVQSFAQLRARALACVRCPHLVAARKNVVFGVGDINASLMFVGEAPGADEDAQGEPFVGAAGQLLTRMIQTMGLSRRTVYIANILKCRPNTPGQSAGNRPPTEEEMETCFPYLLEQIDLIQPRVIVALGATAVKGLLHHKLGITKLRGQWQVFRGIPTMPTYHPAYLLRNQALAEKRKVWEDMLKVMEKLGLPISERQRTYFLKA
jgi:uracil-DNA glycosylase